MSRAAAAIACAAALLIDGCAQYEPRPLQPASSLQALESRRLDDASLQQYLTRHLGRAAPPWDLATLTIAAYYYSPALDVARATHAVAQAGIVTAGRRPLPTLSIPFQYTTNPKPGDSPYTLGLGLDIPIETAGKRGYRVARAAQLSTAAQFDVGAAAWQVRSRLREQLLQLWTQRRRAALLRQQMQDRVELAAMMQRRVALGAASPPELERAQAALAQDRRALSDAQRLADQALAGAAGVIGIPVGALKVVRLELDAFARPPPPLPVATVRDAALHDRADVQAALSRYEASQAALQLVLAQQYPDIHLGPGYTFDAGAHKFALSLAGLPLGSPSGSRGAIAEAEARRKQSGAQFEQTVANALAAADRAAAGLSAASRGLDATDAQLSAQRRILEGARKAFDVGEQDRLGLVSARLQERTVQLDREDALAQVQRSAGASEDAMQRPLDRAAPPPDPEPPR